VKVGFAGTPAFAATVLAALLDADFAIPLVLTQPDRPRGRGLVPGPSPVKALARARGIAVAEPSRLSDDLLHESLIGTGLDVLAVAAYGLLLPPAVLTWPRYGCINVHASLLPRWRGAAPIQRALLAGDGETGTTIMQMDAGLDTGPMLDAVRVRIDPRDSSGTLEQKLAAAGSRALVGVLRRLAAGDPVLGTPQPESGATYAPKIAKAEAAIDWNSDATTIDRQVRAFDPAPGAFTTLAGRAVKIWRAEPDAARGTPPGTVLETGPAGILVACGRGSVRLFELQAAGSRRASSAAFIAGRNLPPGARFGASAA
jgi:methionyl-tRNA formyltransferase